MRVLFVIADFACFMGLVELASHYGLSLGRCCVLGSVALAWNLVGFVEGWVRQ